MSTQSPSPSIQPAPGVGSSSELKRSVSQATERISEIITAAEQVAVEIRTDAETQARDYVAAQQREIDRVVNERSAALDRMTETLVENAERFRRQAEQMLNSVDVVIDEARQALESDRSAISRPSDIPALELAPTPVAKPEFRPEPGFEPMPERTSEPEPDRRSPNLSPSPSPRSRSRKRSRTSRPRLRPRSKRTKPLRRGSRRSGSPPTRAPRSTRTSPRAATTAPRRCFARRRWRSRATPATRSLVSSRPTSPASTQIKS